MEFFLAYFLWNPNPTAFTIPLVNLEVRWYGILFVIGFYLGYLLVEKKVRQIVSTSFFPRDIKTAEFFPEEFKVFAPNEKTPNSRSIFQKLSSLSKDKSLLVKAFPKTLYSPKELSGYFSDHLIWYLVIGTIIGARLGHVFFYEWPYYKNHLLSILNIREGGLASHGGTIGILLALFLFSRNTLRRFPEISFFRLTDLLAAPVALVGFFIRLGNFFNQEIVGKAAAYPWSVLFLHPASGETPIPRHPTQLYEGLFYLFSFFVLLFLPENKLKTGRKTGIFFLLIFGSRFFLEYIKEPPPALVFSEATLLTGQLLSLPFILLGAVLLFSPKIPFLKKG